MDTNDYDHIPGIEKKRTDFFLEMAFFKTKRIIRFMNYLTGVDQLSGAFREWLFKESLAGKFKDEIKCLAYELHLTF